MNIENLTILANHLDTVKPETFGMRDFLSDTAGVSLSPLSRECGTVACAVGHGPAAGLPVEPEDCNDWFVYSKRVFGLEIEGPEWDWCFGPEWHFVDNSPTGAARRIRHVIEYGVPINAYDQARRKAPYIFAKEEA